MRQKVLSILALLLMAVTGAWAQTETLLTTITPTGEDSYSETTTGVVTVTLSSVGFYDEDYGWVWWESGSVTVEAKEGYTITKCVFIQNVKNPVTITTSPFAITFKEGGKCEQDPEDDMNGVTSIEVYGYANAPTVNVTGVSLSETTASMTVGGDALTLTATVAPANATNKTVTWTSSDESVATVADGVVTAVAAGTATITATATNGTADTSDDVTATCTVNVYPWAGSGTADDPFQIQNVDDWNTLAANVTGGETYSGIYFKMTDDIIGVTTRTGKNSVNPFSGTFDGQGHTMNLNIYTTNTTNTDGSTSAPFGYISGATIKNLHITGSETIAYMRAASIAGFAENSTITNCWSEVALTSGYGKDIDCGAFVATVIANSSLTLNGCLFTGTITYTDAAGYEGGGMVGYTRSGGTATLNDCLFAPAGFTVTKYSGHYMFVGGKKRGVLNNCYYNDVAAATSLVKEGKQAFSIVKGDDVSSLAISGEGTEYSVSGITAYATGIKYNDVYYAGSGEAVGLTLSHADREGYSAKDVTIRAYTSWEAASEILTGGGNNPELVSDITVTKNETAGTWQFTMPEANVWVTVTYAKNLQNAWIQAIADQTYTGEAIEPTVTVQDGSAVLTLGTDYTVVYSNNVNTGTATVTVTGMGNYSGTATANFTILADKTALNTAIGEAETYYNSIKDDHAEAAAALKTAIDNAKAMQEKGDATQEEVNNALSALTTAKTTAEDAVLTETKNELNDDITAAETYYNSIKDDHTAAANALKEAIDAAKAVKDNANATQEQVDAAIAALAGAKTTAEGAVLTETKNELNDDITEAEAYYNSISESNPDAAAALQTAINTAKGVQGNANATQSEIESAAQTLNEAVDAAKADVALKRITLTIPAKSYMARIDADKRQIETAVAGVKLFSVNNVTNTEVVLTDELGVIAAEMPYFIYNDNDTEVEVSIIVSSEDADNVDYDSEHFKGTLVDKTFTDEDMEEADHYVLNGGSSFVWVKDAGVLSAGKCWIQLEKSPANARALSIVFEGETTGISEEFFAEQSGKAERRVKSEKFATAPVYDLQGRRVMQPTKGLFIVNGKKVVIK